MQRTSLEVWPDDYEVGILDMNTLFFELGSSNGKHVCAEYP